MDLLRQEKCFEIRRFSHRSKAGESFNSAWF